MQSKQNSDFVVLRETLLKAVGILDRLLATSAVIGSNEILPINYRQYAGGQLNEVGKEEMTRRFEAGYSDSQIALDMGVSLTGVSKNRSKWRRSRL